MRIALTEVPTAVGRGIRYWISPDGAFVAVPPKASHSLLIKELIAESTPALRTDVMFQFDPEARALIAGWTPVKIGPAEARAEVYFGNGKRRMQAWASCLIMG